jgi:hypothetical protein
MPTTWTQKDKKKYTELEFYLYRWPSTCSIREKLNSLWTSKKEPVPSTPLPAVKNKEMGSHLPVLGMTHIYFTLVSHSTEQEAVGYATLLQLSRAVFVLLLLGFEKGE